MNYEAISTLYSYGLDIFGKLFWRQGISSHLILAGGIWLVTQQPHLACVKNSPQAHEKNDFHESSLFMTFINVCREVRKKINPPPSGSEKNYPPHWS